MGFHIVFVEHVHLHIVVYLGKTLNAIKGLIHSKLVAKNEAFSII